MFRWVFSKGNFRREKQDGRLDTIGREEFLEFTKSVWTLTAESARKIGHPAPFPVELAYRLVRMFSFSGDTVLDPFMGTATSLLAAARCSRNVIGVEIEPSYVKMAKARLEEELSTLFEQDRPEIILR